MNRRTALGWTAADARAAFAAASEVGLDALCPGPGLLVVAPHPDDESLGCGGLIARAVEAGQAVTVAVLTDGAGSHPSSRAYPPARLAEVRRAELAQALNALGSGRVQAQAFDAPDGRLGEHEARAQAWLATLGEKTLGGTGWREVESQEIGPPEIGPPEIGPFAAVFAPWLADPHPDHQAAFRIARRQAALWGAALFAYPIWGLTLANEADAGIAASCVRLDVAAVIERKRAAVLAHRSQTTGLIDDDPHGFRLSDADLARHLTPFEVFMRWPTIGEG